MQDYLHRNDFLLPECAAMLETYAGLGVEKDLPLSIFGVRREYLEAVSTSCRRSSTALAITSPSDWISIRQAKRHCARCLWSRGTW